MMKLKDLQHQNSIISNRKIKHLTSNQTIQTSPLSWQNKIRETNDKYTRETNDKYTDFGSQYFIKRIKLKNIQEINRKGSKTIDKYFKSLQQKQLEKQIQKQTFSYSSYLISKVILKENQQSQQFIDQISKKELIHNNNNTFKDREKSKFKTFSSLKNIYQTKQKVQIINKPFQEQKQFLQKKLFQQKIKNFQKRVLIGVNQNKECGVEELKKQNLLKERQTYQTFQDNKQYLDILKQNKKQVSNLKEEIQQQKLIIKLQNQIIQKQQLKLEELTIQIQQLSLNKFQESINKKLLLSNYQISKMSQQQQSKKSQQQQSKNSQQQQSKKFLQQQTEFKLDQLFDWESKLNTLKKYIENALKLESNTTHLKLIQSASDTIQQEKKEMNTKIEYKLYEKDKQLIQPFFSQSKSKQKLLQHINLNYDERKDQSKQILVCRDQFMKFYE